MKALALLLSAVLTVCLWTPAARAADFPVYPAPQEVTLTGGSFDLAEAEIAFYQGPRQDLTAVAGLLSSELARRFFVAVTRKRADGSGSGAGKISLGLSSDPQIIALLAKGGKAPAVDWDVPEGYRLVIDSHGAVIAGHDIRGLFYGVQSFLQLIDSPAPGTALARGAAIADRPFKPLRGVHVYLPARRDLPFFLNYIRAMAHYKFNTMILEVGGGMRLDRHPEVNIAWENFCRAFWDMGDPFQQYGEQVPLGPQNRFQASVHTELAGGSWLTKDEVQSIAAAARENQIDLVPEIQSLSHAYYLTLADRSIAELPEAAWPDSYDPANPKSYELLFDVIDEYLEVLQPEWVHIGHDEWRAGVMSDPGRAYGEDVLKIYRYLQSRGVKTMMWADHLVAGHNMEGRQPDIQEEGVWYAYPNTTGAREMIAAQAKDILMLNWSWGVTPTSDRQILDRGWKMIFGNFDGDRDYEKWHDRLAQPGVLGAEMSTWCLSDEFSYGQNGALLNMLLSQNLLWSDKVYPRSDVFKYLSAETPNIRFLLSGSRLPSLDVLNGRQGYEFVTLDLSAQAGAGLDFSGVPAGKVTSGGLPFAIGAPDKRCVAAGGGKIAVNSNAASILFLHVSDKATERRSTYFSNYPADTAVLIGYYLITYADGLRESVPVSFGRNIAQYGGDWSDQVYYAHTVKLADSQEGKPVLAYAAEWVVTRPNRVIESVELVGVDPDGGANPVLLAVTLLKPPFEK